MYLSEDYTLYTTEIERRPFRGGYKENDQWYVKLLIVQEQLKNKENTVTLEYVKDCIEHHIAIKSLFLYSDQGYEYRERVNISDINEEIETLEIKIKSYG